MLFLVSEGICLQDLFNGYIFYDMFNVIGIIFLASSLAVCILVINMFHLLFI